MAKHAIIMPGKKIILVTFVIALILVAAFSGVQVHTLSERQKTIKRDYSGVNNVSFGILSVSRWRDLVIDAVGQQIDSFRLTPAERDSLQKEVETLLDALIDKADSIISRPQKSLGGKVRKLVFHAFVKPTNLHKETPAFAKKIIAGVMRPRSRRRLASVAKSKLEDLSEHTYDSAYEEQRTRFDSVFKRYSVANLDDFNKRTDNDLTVIHKKMMTYVWIMLASLAVLLSLWYLLRKQKPLLTTLYILSIFMALVFLVTGLTSVTIELDARIDALNFHILGETISFKDQVIFFQSKSIVDVVILLLQNGKINTICVGVLLLCFSILFPIAKLVCTGLYLIGKRQWTKSRIVGFFAFHSGKWSMADVMVVALFMAYIGFNGILNDQLRDLNINSSAFTSIATNRTSLQPGYLIFVTFVLFGLALSQLLHWLNPQPDCHETSTPLRRAHR
ncbi:MAG TPA: paraquat-inducible protein A [Puia sp.]|uniref:paraquat-inducible protein A n=1 Tax=Puia sp. TaxID=2045100 RepID=UPI002CDE3D42|nr:paraquat-inducible protein A [Puia sp.]HVU93999.1 paraquat-inducible protein A [Puia sp.]